ncbi:MAG: hypothetical protein V4850_36800 [Myxococcota bacterium]
MLLLVLSACSDYDLNGKDEEPVFDPGDTAVPIDTDTDTVDTDTGTVDTDTASCPDQAFPGGTLAPRDECGSAPTVGSFEPVEEWAWESFSTSSSSNNVMMTPIVVSLTDDDGDGDADSDDIPDIVFVTYTDTEWSSARSAATGAPSSGASRASSSTGARGSRARTWTETARSRSWR